MHPKKQKNIYIDNSSKARESFKISVSVQLAKTDVRPTWLCAAPPPPLSDLRTSAYLGH